MLSFVASLVLVVVLTALLVMIVVVYVRTGVPTVMSPRAAQALAARVLAQRRARIIYELGSGKGDFVLTLARALPNARVYGLELSPAAYLYARIRTMFSGARGKISFVLKDFKKVSLSSADAVVFYLMLHANKKLAPKLERELRPGTTVVSVSFSVADWIPEQVVIARNWTKTRVLVYSMPPKKKSTIDQAPDRLADKK